MDKKLELIKNLKDELEELKSNFEIAYINYTNNIAEKKQLENKIITTEEIKNKKENKQAIILIKKAAILLVSITAILEVAPAVVTDILIKIIFITMMIGMMLTVIPRTSKIIYNCILKLSPKLNELETEINGLKKKLSTLKQKKQTFEEENKELTNILNTAELDMKNKEKEVREAEDVYFDNLFNKENTNLVNNPTPHKTTIRVRKKLK